MNRIKEELARIFESKKTKTDEKLDLEDELEIETGMRIVELDREDLIRLTIPFIKGITRNSKDYLIKFIRNILELKIEETAENIEKDPVLKQLIGYKCSKSSESYRSIFDGILEGKIGRSSKIKLNETVRKLDFRYIDWEDKDFLHSMVEACLCKALLLLRSMINEDEIAKRDDNNENDEIEENNTKVKVVKLMDCGHLNPVELTRKDILKRRINPTKTLDEYVEWLQANTKKETKQVSKEKTIEEQRKWDDFRDFKRNFKGNTKNIG